MKVEITDTPFDPFAAVSAYQEAQLERGAFGASCVFTGSMRDFNEGDDVSAMTLEHYPGMTEKELTRIVMAAIEEHELLDALVVHRVGKLMPADPIVLVAVWSSHRRAAFEACREIMEYLKSKAPFWKKETLSDGSRWVEKNTAG